MIIADIYKIEDITGLEPELYHSCKKMYFYRDVIMNDNLNSDNYDPIISKNQLRYVSEYSWRDGSWIGGSNIVVYITTNLKYVSKNNLMFKMDNNKWDPEIREIETKSHFVYFRKNDDWKRVKSSSTEALEMRMKYVAELI